jgi:hypothetical protein
MIRCCPYCGEHLTDLWDNNYHEELVAACGSCHEDYWLCRRMSVNYEPGPFDRKNATEGGVLIEPVLDAPAEA